MKTRTSLLIALGLMGLTATGLRAQVGINNSATSPDPSAILDLKTGNTGVNKGFLPQSVALTDVTVAAPVTLPATGLIVYSSTAPTGGNGIGYYFWNGTAWAGMGSISGSGATGQVSFWNGTNTLTGSNNLFWDNTDGWLGIGTATPGRPLQVGSSIANYTVEFDNLLSGGTALLADAGGSFGYGVYAIGDYEAVLGITNNAGSYGLVGGNNAASGTGTGVGTYGSTYQSSGCGVEGLNYYATNGVGVGIYGAGSGASGAIQFFGEGVFSQGIGEVGIYGRSNATTGQAAGGYFDNNIAGYVSDYVWVAYSNGTEYKIIGAGTVSTLVKDSNNTIRTMNCPEAPEILFEDYGSATLSSGKVHVNLDATYAKNVTINEKHPLRVLITLEGDCNGVYVTNKTATGFDVVELKAGTSNVKFTYEVIANRADEYDANGKLISKNADNRFVQGPGPLVSTASTTAQAAVKNPATPPAIGNSSVGTK